MNLEQIKELMAGLAESKLKKLVVKRGDFELQLEKETTDSPIQAHLPPPYQPAAAFAHAVEQHQANKAPAIKAAAPVQEAPAGRFVTSPMVGTFYATPSPDEPPFIKVGDKVEEHTVVCIVEAMKVMNEVKAGQKGTVVEILVDNAEPVEFGAKILRIE